MITSIMQPYFFPSLLYFQMIHASDTFFLYDDVNYRRGWINRDTMFFNDKIQYINVPLKKASQNKKINEIEIDWYPKDPDITWFSTFRNNINTNFKSAPFYKEVDSLLLNIFYTLEPHHTTLHGFLQHVIRTICEVLNIKTEIHSTTLCYSHNQDLKGAYRLADICYAEGSRIYINTPGGKNLYKQSDFGLSTDLYFISTDFPMSNQVSSSVTPSTLSQVSILQMLLQYGFEGTEKYLDYYLLEKAHD